MPPGKPELRAQKRFAFELWNESGAFTYQAETLQLIADQFSDRYDELRLERFIAALIESVQAYAHLARLAETAGLASWTESTSSPSVALRSRSCICHWFGSSTRWANANEQLSVLSAATGETLKGVVEFFTALKTHQ